VCACVCVCVCACVCARARAQVVVIDEYSHVVWNHQLAWRWATWGVPVWV
jgi:hypothetical protein